MDNPRCEWCNKPLPKRRHLRICETCRRNSIMRLRKRTRSETYRSRSNQSGIVTYPNTLTETHSVLSMATLTVSVRFDVGCFIVCLGWKLCGFMVTMRGRPRVTAKVACAVSQRSIKNPCLTFPSLPQSLGESTTALIFPDLTETGVSPQPWYHTR